MKNKRITAAEIAKIAGVSRSTVTGVVNDYSFISEETKKHVRQIIKEYGYVPNSAARGLVGKTPKIIGHFVYGQSSRIYNTYIENMMVGVIEAAQQVGYSVVTSIITPERNVEVTKLLQNGTIQGAIVAGGSNKISEIENLLISRFPVVFVNKISSDFDLSGYKHKHIVKSDNVKGGFTATDYLINQGHRDILHITGLPDRLSAKDRKQGYLEALTAHNIEVNPDRILTGDYTKDKAKMLFDECIRSGSLPSAVFTANDMTAIGVMHSCRQEGIRIPEDISLIGFDDMMIASEVQPALTTMTTGSHSLSKTAVTVLLESLEDDEYASQVEILAPQLVIRDSVRDLTR